MTMPKPAPRELPQEDMPAERVGLTKKVHINGIVGYVTANTRPDGTLREVFVHGFGALGSTNQGWTDAFGVMLSHQKDL